jgi:hypothetical protein
MIPYICNDLPLSAAKMKFTCTILLSIILYGAAAQDALIPKQYELHQQRDEAARAFIDLVLNNSRNFLEPANKVVMLKNNTTLDTLDFTKDYYQGGGSKVSLNPVKPSYYNTLARYMCTSANPAEKSGCEINVKKLAYIIKGDFNNFQVNALKKVGDTLEVTINFAEDRWVNRFKFNTKGLIESAATFEVDAGNHKTLRGENKYYYDKNGNLIKKEATQYPPIFNQIKLANQFMEVDYTSQGAEDREIKKRFQYNDKGELVKTYLSGAFFFYDTKYNLVKKQLIVDDELSVTYQLEYKRDVVEITKTSHSTNKTEPFFAYRLVR